MVIRPLILITPPDMPVEKLVKKIRQVLEPIGTDSPYRRIRGCEAGLQRRCGVRGHNLMPLKGVTGRPEADHQRGRPRWKEMRSEARNLLRGGVDTVQLRRRDLSGRNFYTLALRLRKMTGNKKARFIINDRLDVALAVGADGVHLGRGSFSPELARSILGPGKIIGRSVHSLREFSPKEEKYLDYLIVSPIFATASKPGARPLGIDILKRLKEKTCLPLYALGGITLENIYLLKDRACGVAVMSSIFKNRNPVETAKKMREKSKHFS